MTFRAAILTLGLMATGCTTSTLSPLTHSACVGISPYTGPPLRAPINSDEINLEVVASSAVSPEEISALSKAFDRAQEATGASSLTVAVWQSGGQPWIARKGTPAGHLHYWASVGKTVTAAAILRLEQDERLSLDDPIADYVDGVPNGDVITLQMLMAHTSGLFSANEDPGLQAAGTPIDLPGVLEIVRQQPPYACPAAAWRYSNTGYTLLGAVIEDVTGKPYHLAARDLVLARSAAQNIRMLAPGDALEGIVALEDRRFDIRGPQAAGGVVADAESMALFHRDLLAGRILPRETVRRMTRTLYPMFDENTWYGLGLMVYDVPGPNDGSVWIGHSGGVPGGHALIAFDPDRDAIVTVALTGDGSAEATANLLFASLDRMP